MLAIRKREALFLASVLLSSLWPHATLTSISVLLVLSHLILYKGATRWQFWPAHLACLLCALLLEERLLGLYHGSWSRLIAQCVSLVLSLSSVLLNYLMPMPRVDVFVRGMYKVGMSIEHVVVKSKNLQFNVRLYYPVQEPVALTTRPYMAYGRDSSNGFAVFMDMPGVVFSHLSQLTMQLVASSHTPQLPADMPLLMFSHGLGAAPDCYQGLILDIASRGFVVAAVEHNDGSQSFTMLPGGRKSYYKKLQTLKTETGKGEYDIRHDQLLQRVAEISAALDHVERCVQGEESSQNGQDHFLRNSIDLSKVAAAGHSFGGATVTEWGHTDAGKRLKAIVNLDGWQEPLSKHVVEEGVPHTPMLLLEGEGFQKWSENFDSMRCMYSHSHPKSVFFSILDAGHQNFSDFAFLSPPVIRRMQKRGWKYDPRETLHLISDCVGLFLHEHLRLDDAAASAGAVGFGMPASPSGKAADGIQTWNALMGVSRLVKETRIKI